MSTKSALEQLEQLETQYAASRAVLLADAEKDLSAKLKDARAVVADLERQMADLRGGGTPKARTRLSAAGVEQLKTKLGSTLKANPKGLKMSQIIAAVGTDAKTLRSLLKEINAKTTGEKRATIYKL